MRAGDAAAPSLDPSRIRGEQSNSFDDVQGAGGGRETAAKPQPKPQPQQQSRRRSNGPRAATGRKAWVVKALYVALTPVQGKITRILVGPDASKDKLKGQLGDLQQISGLSGVVMGFTRTDCFSAMRRERGGENAPQTLSQPP